MTSPTTPTIARRAYTIKQFCDAHSVGRTKANELMHDGILETRHLGRRVLITAESADRWWNSLPVNKLAQKAA
jgi:hypothetical protein